jgi:ElaB/YqjD/DUF883 family membrane-anchored ribosome-binding protein
MDESERRQMQAIIGKELIRAKRLALREIAEVEDGLVDALGSVERYVKKHPRQAAAVTLSLGAALGAAGALFLTRKSRR